MVGFLETVEDVSLLRKLNETTSHAYKFNNIIGRSPEMEKIFQILPSLAQSDSSVLITGETGTGKDMVAEAIHQSSNRAKGPFVKINCGALPETLLESELFGHRKGAFTGAVENKPGRFQLAHNGTLYLTEIGDLPLSLQVKLLTFLDDKEVFPLGSVKGVIANVRIIAATHRNLEQRVNDNRFRKDLLFRLNVIRLHLPPLRDRQGDVQLLLDHFLNTLSSQLGKQKHGLSRKSLKSLLSYSYPGNVRELRNIIEYAVNICGDRQIKPKHLPTFLMDAGRVDVRADAQSTPSRLSFKTEGSNPMHLESHQNWPDIEKQMIIEALVRASGRKNKAAVSLGWARSTLWRKIKQYGIG
jgi:two-component system response regulator AtoC